MYLQVAGPADDVQTVLSAVSGVTRVTAAVGREDLADVEVDAERGRDIRRELAATVVGRGWGLLELRPMRMSLEDIFLTLTTEDVAERSGDDVVAPHTPESEEEVADA
jgi:ABC-2 type transport system ATP-binding protein